MIRWHFKKEFRLKLSEKLMDLGNLAIAALVFGQFVSDREFSMGLLISGIILMLACYIGSYIISL